MWKKVITLMFGVSTLALGGDATTDNIPKIEARDYSIAGEMVKLKEVDNVVEAEFSWKDATPIKVAYDLGEPTLAEKVKDKRDKEVLTETVADFDGGFKVDILLNGKPATNVFCYAIQGAENYDFFYQPPLTAEEIAGGESRPPEIEGSYAVYHKTLKNHQIGKENYATGKVMHIPRPQVWSLDDVDTKVWADMNYDSGNLCVTVPQDFLDKAKYPVRVDPTFGYTTAGASSLNIARQVTSVDESLRQGITYTSTATGTVTRMYAYTDANTTINVTTSYFISTENSGGSGVHGQVATSETDFSYSTTKSWKSLAISASVASNTPYVLSLVGDGADFTTDNAAHVFYDAVTTRNYYGESFLGGTQYSDSKENPWTNAAVSAARSTSLYVLYQPTEAGTYTDNFTSIGTHFWTAPTGVTEVIAACWGAGGGGGIIGGSGGAGGGGGAFASSTLSVTAGNTYNIFIGTGGLADSAVWAQQSAFSTSTCPTCVVAAGGQGASPTGATTEGAGGPTATSTGTTKFAGGAGGDGNGSNDVGGGAGGSAGPHGGGAAGQNTAAASTTGGAGGTADAGTGGAGGAASSGAGNVGISNAFGGGGGGGANDNVGGSGGYPGGGGGGGETGGGVGGNGQCTLTYTVSAGGGETPQYIEEIYFFQ